MIGTLKLQIIGTDYLTRLLNKWKIPVWVPPLFLILEEALYSFVIWGTLNKSGQNPGLIGPFEDPSLLGIGLLAQPVWLAFYLIYPTIASEAIQKLAEKGVVKPGDSDKFNQVIAGIHRRLNHRWILVVSIIAGLLYSYAVLRQSTAPAFENVWTYHLHWPLYFHILPRTFLSAYILSFSIFRVFIVHLGLSSLYEQVEIEVQPLNEDCAGGMGSIGEMVGGYLYPLLAAIIFLVTCGMAEHARSKAISDGLLIVFAILPVFTCIVFFVPLLSTHHAMVSSAQKSLKKFNHDYASLMAGLNNKNEPPTEGELSQLNRIMETAEKVRAAFPTWPFNIRTLNSFKLGLAASVFPILLSIITKIVQDYIVKFIP